jgi:allophanate hydrolase
MTAARFTVVQAGPLVTIQDRGRFGQMRFGVPASGPMDRAAFAIANAALGNPPDTAGIEVSLGGLTLDCVAGQVSFALIGGGFVVEIDGVRSGSWTVASIAAGQRLTIRPGRWGCWTYLVFAGDLDSTRWLGSAATHVISGLGGGALRPGTTLNVTNAALRPARHGPVRCPVFARPRSEIRVVMGPQDRFFGAATLQTFLQSTYTLTPSYDRMGMRLSGPSLRPDATLDMPSEAILRGSVQVAGDGVPTVLMADHQTTGGYPKIATILSDDLDAFARLRPHSQVAFRATDPASAVATFRTGRLALARYLSTLGRVTGS